MVLSLLFIMIVLLLIGSFTDNNIYYGLAFIALALMVLVATFSGSAVVIIVPLLIGLAFLFMGLGLTIFSAMENRGIDIGNYAGIPFYGGMGFIFNTLLLYDIYKLIACSKKVVATYMGCDRYPVAKGPDQYTPKFSYCFNGRKYLNATGSTYTAKKISKKYDYSAEYKIYVDPRNPNIIMDSRKLRLFDFFCLFSGIFCFGLIYDALFVI